MTQPIDRRSFLGASASLAVLAGLAPFAGAEPGVTGNDRPVADAGSRARNLIFMVADGMSIGTFQLAQRACELEGRSSAWAELIRTPGARSALADTRSANSEVTDSAAASTAWSTGVRVDNGAVCVAPGGRTLTPLYHRVRATGRRTGLVTTTRLTHATPAAFATVVDERSSEDDIAQQLLAPGHDVLLGGGARYITDDRIAERSDRGVRVVRTARELAVEPARDGALLGVFADDHMVYELDRGSTQQPSLAEMTRAALTRLSAPPAAGDESPGFVLQVEGGRVDHAAHSCDAAALLRDQLAFDDAVRAALDFAAERDDTLLIVTTDHGNAAPSLTHYGPSKLGVLGRATASFEVLLPQIESAGPRVEASRLRLLVGRATGVALADDELALFSRCLRGETVNAFEGMRAPAHVLGSLLANHSGVHFVSGAHTAEPALLTAFGPGADRIPPYAHLTDTHEAVAAALEFAS